MPSWLPAVAYPPAQDGFWSPVTSTINWCEEDYYATIYSAEIINSLTNLLFVWLATKGLISCWKNGHNTIFAVTYAGFMVVGIGSALFHSSLKYPMQLVDELSMIYTTCLMCYATFSYSRSRQFSIILAVGLVGLALFITLYYHYLQDPTFHQNAYAILTAVVLFRAMWMMEFNLRPSLRKKEEEHKLLRKRSMNAQEKAALQVENKRDEDVLHTMWIMVACGLSIFLGGFGIWTLDNKYCSSVRVWRREIGMPWGFLLEGHGWWHLMTGIGAYFYITWGIWLRHCLNGLQDEYVLQWPSVFFSVPQCVRVSDRNGVVTNGSTKKIE